MPHHRWVQALAWMFSQMAPEVRVSIVQRGERAFVDALVSTNEEVTFTRDDAKEVFARIKAHVESDLVPALGD